MFGHKKVFLGDGVTHIFLWMHPTREEEVGDGGENQAAGGDEQTHPPGPDPAGVTLSQLLFGSCRKTTMVSRHSCLNLTIKELWDA